MALGAQLEEWVLQAGNRALVFPGQWRHMNDLVRSVEGPGRISTTLRMAALPQRLLWWKRVEKERPRTHLGFLC